VTPDRIQGAVDRLIARDGCYRPEALLRLTLRLVPESREAGSADGSGFLEDALYGDPDRVVDMLRLAAAWAEQLGLRAEVEEPGGKDPRWFRNPVSDRLVRTVWQRAAAQPQADLFFDNRFAVARGNLARALVEARADQAEECLAEMARAGGDPQAQADAEHLVGALAWLDEPVTDAALSRSTVERELAPRAQRFLGRREAAVFLGRLWRWLVEAQDPSDFDPARPDDHPSYLLARLDDHAGVIDAVHAVGDHLDHPTLVERLVDAGLNGERRDTGLAALCQLCWRHPERAEAWLDACRDDELVRRVERFWDLEPPLAIGLFPAWLVSASYPLPDLAAEAIPPGDDGEAMLRFRALRRQPGDRDHRQWLQQHCPDLLRHWLT